MSPTTDGFGPPCPALVAVVAVSDNGVIGRDNALPWRLRTDLQRFKRLTMGKAMIVGRKNWDAIGRPLPGRETIVMTRTPGFSPAGAHVAHDWADALAQARRLSLSAGMDEIIVGGGAEIYRLAMPLIDRIRLTRVHAEVDGDVTLPAYDESAFRETFREHHPAGPADEHSFTFIDLERLGSRETTRACDAGR